MIVKHSTELGAMWSTWTTRGLFQFGWDQPREFDGCLEGGSRGRNGWNVEDFDDCLQRFCRGLPEDFLSVVIDTHGWTPFVTRVYECCRAIPAGTTITYGQLAKSAGNQKASRAVGGAMSRNRLLLVIPCHRVIGASGQLRGFSAPGGLETKRRLLTLEGIATPKLLTNCATNSNAEILDELRYE